VVRASHRINETYGVTETNKWIVAFRPGDVKRLYGVGGWGLGFEIVVVRSANKRLVLLFALRTSTAIR